MNVPSTRLPTDRKSRTRTLGQPSADVNASAGPFSVLHSAACISGRPSGSNPDGTGIGTSTAILTASSFSKQSCGLAQRRTKLPRSLGGWLPLQAFRTASARSQQHDEDEDQQPCSVLWSTRANSPDPGRTGSIRSPRRMFQGLANCNCHWSSLTSLALTGLTYVERVDPVPNGPASRALPALALRGQAGPPLQKTGPPRSSNNPATSWLLVLLPTKIVTTARLVDRPVAFPLDSRLRTSLRSCPATSANDVAEAFLNEPNRGDHRTKRERAQLGRKDSISPTG